eukprot:3937208-Rhodomonas_salina.3
MADCMTPSRTMQPPAASPARQPFQALNQNLPVARPGEKKGATAHDDLSTLKALTKQNKVGLYARAFYNGCVFHCRHTLSVCSHACCASVPLPPYLILASLCDSVLIMPDVWPSKLDTCRT